MGVAAAPTTDHTRALRHQRQFVLLTTGQAVSAVGNSVAPIAIAFAVLQLTGSAQDLGLVVAGRSGALALCVLFGGVVADRIPRQFVLTGGALVAAASEAATAALLLSHTARIWEIAALQILNGATAAFVFPAAQGALPQTVTAESLHQANVVSRMSSNIISILGAAAGGALVAAVDPGWAVAVDSISFLIAAVFFASLRLPRVRPGKSTEKPGLFRELAEGWTDFRSRTWLWSIVLQFCFVNAAFGGMVDVLGPLTAKTKLGGAHSWGLIMACFSLGFLVGGLAASRLRYVRRPLLVAAFAVLVIVPFFALFAIPAALAVLCAASFAGGVGTEIFGVEWNVTMQREIPADRLARLSSYDMLGSIVCLPVGQAVIGAVQVAAGLRTSVLICTALALVPSLAVLAVRDVRTLRGEPRPLA